MFKFHTGVKMLEMARSRATLEKLNKLYRQQPLGSQWWNSEVTGYLTHCEDPWGATSPFLHHHRHINQISQQKYGENWPYVRLFVLTTSEIWFIINHLFACVTKIKTPGKKFMKIKTNRDNNLTILQCAKSRPTLGFVNSVNMDIMV